MKILRFLGIFVVFFGLNLGTAYAVGCDDNEYGNLSDSSCTTCPASYPLSFVDYNTYEGQCFKKCTNACAQYDWSNFFPADADRTVMLFDTTTPSYQIEFKMLAGDICGSTQNSYCTYQVTCAGNNAGGGQAAYACKPGHKTVTFKSQDDTTIGTLWVVHQSVWSAHPTNANEAYSNVFYPVFKTPDAPAVSNKKFVGWYDSANGGNLIIAPASVGVSYGELNFANANGITTDTTLYARYEDAYTVQVQCSSTANPQSFNTYSAGDTFTINDIKTDVVKYCLSLCNDGKTQNGWDVLYGTPAQNWETSPVDPNATITIGSNPPGTPITIMPHCESVTPTYTATFTCKPVNSVYSDLLTEGYTDATMYADTSYSYSIPNLVYRDSFTPPTLGRCQLLLSDSDRLWFATPNPTIWVDSVRGTGSYTPGQSYNYGWRADETFSPSYGGMSVRLTYSCVAGNINHRETISFAERKNVAIKTYDEVGCAVPEHATSFNSWKVKPRDCSSSYSLSGQELQPGNLADQGYTEYPACAHTVYTQWNCEAGYTYDSATGTCVANTYTVTYSCGDGATGTAPNDDTVTYGTTPTLPSDGNEGSCTKNGYTLTGWRIDGESTDWVNGTSVYNYTSNKNMTAQWTENTYTATFECTFGYPDFDVFDSDNEPTPITDIQLGQTISLPYTNACVGKSSYPECGRTGIYKPTPYGQWRYLLNGRSSQVYGGTNFTWPVSDDLTFQITGWTAGSTTVVYSCGTVGGTAPGNQTIDASNCDTVQVENPTNCAPGPGDRFLGWYSSTFNTLFQPGDIISEVIPNFIVGLNLTAQWECTDPDETLCKSAYKVQVQCNSDAEPQIISGLIYGSEFTVGHLSAIAKMCTGNACGENEVQNGWDVFTDDSTDPWGASPIGSDTIITVGSNPNATTITIMPHCESTISTYTATFTCMPQGLAYDLLSDDGYTDEEMYSGDPIEITDLAQGDSFIIPGIEQCTLLPSNDNDRLWFSRRSEWIDSETYAYDLGQSYNYRWDADHDFNLVYGQKKIRMMYYCSGNSATADNIQQVLFSGRKTVEVKTPTNAGCTMPDHATGFLYWKVENNADCQSEFSLSNQELQPGLLSEHGHVQYPACDHKLYAHWQCESGYTYNESTDQCVANTYTITYKPNYGGTTQNVTQGVRYSAEFTTKPANTFTRTGHIITAWGDDETVPSTNYPELSTQYTYHTAYDKDLFALWKQCEDGTQPNADGTACEPCPEGTYGTGGTCEPCGDGYSSEPGSTSIEDCILTNCPDGQHMNHGQCDLDEISCDAPYATSATRKWNPRLNAYDSCQIQECEEGYHIASNACVPDDGECVVANGRGGREWNNGAWDICKIIQCDPGYIVNNAGTACERCSNYLGYDGQQAVSSYVTECEIASCMYQGQKYALINGECEPICETTTDDSGSKRWDNNLKKCVRTCNPGYKMW